MPRWLHRTDKALLVSIAAADLPEPIANYIEEPDLAAVAGVPPRYWNIVGDVVSEMSPAEKAAVDDAALQAQRDAVVADMDRLEEYTRAFALVVLDEFNDTATTINQILDAIDNANNLGDVKTAVAAIADRPIRTIANLKTAVRDKLGS